MLVRRFSETPTAFDADGFLEEARSYLRGHEAQSSTDRHA